MSEPSTLWARARTDPAATLAEIRAAAAEVGDTGAAARLGVSVETLRRIRKRLEGEVK